MFTAVLPLLLLLHLPAASSLPLSHCPSSPIPLFSILSFLHTNSSNSFHSPAVVLLPFHCFLRISGTNLVNFLLCRQTVNPAKLAFVKKAFYLLFGIRSFFFIKFLSRINQTFHSCFLNSSQWIQFFPDLPFFPHLLPFIIPTSHFIPSFLSSHCSPSSNPSNHLFFLSFFLPPGSNLDLV